MNIKIVSAAVSLFVENCVAAFFWLFVWIGFFICLWVAGYSSYETTIIFWLGTTFLYLWGLGRLVLPLKSDILARAEQASGLKHRPLQSLKDISVTQGKEDLWLLEKSRQKSLLSKLKHSKPDLQLTRRDPYALRIAFILIIASAVFIAPASIIAKIRKGVRLPDLETSGEIAKPFAQIRITPPAYSGLKPVILTSSVKKIPVLAGSVISAEVQTSLKNPVLKMAETQTRLEQKDKTDIWTAKTIIPETSSFKITTYGIPRFSQSVKWIKDNSPIIGWNGPIEILPSGEMRLPLKIADDYGIQKLTLRAILVPGEVPPVFGSPLLMEKKVNLSIRGSAETKPVFDTTGHVWAGRRASIMIEAEDFAGNVSDTAPLEIVLPVRNFHDPVAIQLADTRLDLLNLRGNVLDVLEQVEAILYNPESYKWDAVMTLGLRSIDSRLHYSPTKDDIESVASMMWSLALRMEDGQVGETQMSLRQALDKLQDAIQKGASKAEIAELMQQMQQALLQHLQTLAKQLQRNAQTSESQLRETIDANSLSKFLQSLQSDIAKGDTNSAMQKLSQLQQLTDMLGSSAAQGLPKDLQEMAANLEELQNLIARQKKLLDQTRQGHTEQVSDLLKEQRDIEAKARTLADKLKIKPPPVDMALNELTQSIQGLESKNLALSADHQQKALDLLEQGSKELQKNLQQKMQNMMGLSLGGSGSQDPLGRSQTSIRDDGTEIPGGTTAKKTDQILKTLREREADMKRPLEERNYYQRLLKQW